MESTDFGEALKAGTAVGGIINHSGSPFVIVPKGYELKDLEPLLPAPNRIHEQVSFSELDSFIRYVNEFKSSRTRCFVRKGSGGIVVTAVIDFHAKDSPSWSSHKAVYVSSFTEEWSRWLQGNKVQFDQTKFCEHLETNALIIVDPNGAAMIEMIENLEGHNNARFESGVKLQNGRVQLKYEEDVQLRGVSGSQKGALEIPAQITCAIAPFLGGSKYEVKSRLRYRINERKLVFWYEIIDAHVILDDAIKGIRAQIDSDTGITPFAAA